MPVGDFFFFLLGRAMLAACPLLCSLYVKQRLQQSAGLRAIYTKNNNDASVYTNEV